jgi:uncharacterized protein (DUF433 family)
MGAALLLADQCDIFSYMSNQNENTAETRITFNPAQCGGRPCIRGMRIRVSDILEMLADGVSPETILADFPDLEPQDISAALRFAAKRVDIPRLAA